MTSPTPSAETVCPKCRCNGFHQSDAFCVEALIRERDEAVGIIRHCLEWFQGSGGSREAACKAFLSRLDHPQKGQPQCE